MALFVEALRATQSQVTLRKKMNFFFFIFKFVIIIPADDGSVWACGENSLFQIGPRSEDTFSKHFVQIPGLSEVVGVSTSFSLSLALTGKHNILFRKYYYYPSCSERPGVHLGRKNRWEEIPTFH